MNDLLSLAGDLVSSGHLTPTGATRLEQLSQAQLRSATLTAGQVDTISRWWRADITLEHLRRVATDPNLTHHQRPWARYKMLEWLSGIFGVSPATLEQDSSTAKAWPQDKRVAGVPFTAHRALNRYVNEANPDHREAALDTAAELLQSMADDDQNMSPNLVTANWHQVTGGREKAPSRTDNFPAWLDLAGINGQINESSVTLENHRGRWNITAVLDGGRPALDITYEEA